jgi:hypothetical protein
MNGRLKLSVLSLVFCLALAPCMSLAILQAIPIEGCVSRQLSNQCAKEAQNTLGAPLLLMGTIGVVACALSVTICAAITKYSTCKLTNLTCGSFCGLLFSIPVMIAGTIMYSEATNKCCNQMAKRTQCFYDE